MAGVLADLVAAAAELHAFLLPVDGEHALYNVMWFAWIALVPVTVLSLFVYTAPYGKHDRHSWLSFNEKWSWFVMEAPSPLLIGGCFALRMAYLNGMWGGDGDGGNGGGSGGDGRDLSATMPLAVFCALWCAHYFNRTVVYPFRKESRGNKMPLVVVLSAIAFNLFNGYINGRALFLADILTPADPPAAPAWLAWMYPQYAVYTHAWMATWQFRGGVALFMLGFAINYHSDMALINLRRNATASKKKDGGGSGSGSGDVGGSVKTHYKIPRGGMFEYVSCANYFGELVEWCGFALLTSNVAAVGFAVWTAANLVPRALDTHRWYQRTFGASYPANRTAVIPYLI